MQKDGVKIADCSLALDHLIDSVQENYDDGSSDFYQCLLGTDHIAPNSSKLKSPEFTSGVIKIQKGEHSSMTPSEHKACSELKAKQNKPTDDSDMFLIVMRNSYRGERK